MVRSRRCCRPMLCCRLRPWLCVALLAPCSVAGRGPGCVSPSSPHALLPAVVLAAIGMYAGRPLLEKFASKKNITKLDYIFDNYGSMGIFIAAVSPIPYKALAWAAGSSRMDLRLFISAGIFGRGLRFGLEGIILGLWGNEFLNLIENPLFWLVGGIMLTVIFIPLNNWWSNLISIPKNDV